MVPKIGKLFIKYSVNNLLLYYLTMYELMLDFTRQAAGNFKEELIVILVENISSFMMIGVRIELHIQKGI